jgi:hypothetical protein
MDINISAIGGYAAKHAKTIDQIEREVHYAQISLIQNKQYRKIITALWKDQNPDKPVPSLATSTPILSGAESTKKQKAVLPTYASVTAAPTVQDIEEVVVLPQLQVTTGMMPPQPFHPNEKTQPNPDAALPVIVMEEPQPQSSTNNTVEKGYFTKEYRVEQPRPEKPATITPEKAEPYIVEVMRNLHKPPPPPPPTERSPWKAKAKSRSKKQAPKSDWAEETFGPDPPPQKAGPSKQGPLAAVRGVGFPAFWPGSLVQ